MGPANTFRKTYPADGGRVLEWEAAGLRWLGEVGGGAPVVPVVEARGTDLYLERLASVPPDASAAEEFGRRLAVTHDAGADWFGAAPREWEGDGYFGPLGDPLPLPLPAKRAGADQAAWGEFYAEERLLPLLKIAVRRGVYETAERSQFDPVIRRLHAGEFDDGDAPSRLHGDLWSGNVMWTGAGVVLIDPAACGGHRETDLAMLHLFGAPALERIVAGYESVHQLQPEWRTRLPLHQLHGLLAHAVLFGGGYGSQTLAAARRYR